MNKYIKEELEKLIFEDKMSYIKIGEMYNVSDNAIKKACNRLGIKLPRRSVFPEGFIPANKRTDRVCLNCNNIFTKTHSTKYCSKRCEAIYKVVRGYKKYIENQESYCGKHSDLRNYRKFILSEQGGVCDICKIYPVWNEKPMSFILDHIDGRAYNNLRINLRLICHNCDSQLDTYKAKNKNSDRKDRYK